MFQLHLYIVVYFAGTEQVVVDPFDPVSRARPQVVTSSNHSSPTTSGLNNLDPDDDDAFEVSASHSFECLPAFTTGIKI